MLIGSNIQNNTEYNPYS